MFIFFFKGFYVLFFKGLFILYANALPKLKPTDRQTTRPGPAVDAIASISSFFTLAFYNAASTTGIIFDWCALEASSGTTPP